MNEEIAMSQNEAFVLEGIDELARDLDGLREQVRCTVRRGAQVGAVMTELSKQRRVALWVWLRGLREDIREDVVRFAIQSNAKMMKDAMLTNTSQLTFALADPAAFAEAGGVQRPSRLAHDAFADFAQAVARATIKMADFMEEYPAKKWNDQMRMQLKEVLRPLLEPLEGVV